MLLIIVVCVIFILLIFLGCSLYMVRSSIEIQNQIIWPSSKYCTTENYNQNEGYLVVNSKNDCNRHIIYFHGNAEPVKSALSRLQILHEVANLYLIEYPCYSNISPLNNLHPETFWPHIVETVTSIIIKINNGYPNQKIIFYGRSIGTGVLCELLNKDKYISDMTENIILETPFTSIGDIFTHLAGGMISNILGDKLHWELTNHSHLVKFHEKHPNVKYLIIAGKKDKLTPFVQAQKIVDSLGEHVMFHVEENKGHLIGFDLILDDIIKFVVM